MTLNIKNAIYNKFKKSLIIIISFLGFQDRGYNRTVFLIYKLFLLAWIIIGLGYLVMVFGFITRGMKSKRICELEHKLAMNLKKTPQKIREEIRSLLQDILIMKVKRVYKEEFEQTVPALKVRSNSCPDLELYRNKESPTLRSRKRAFSESLQRVGELHRIQSDTELDRIDKNLTFESSAMLLEQSNLLLRVVNALGQCTADMDQQKEETRDGIQGFSDAEILASETYDSNWSFGSQKLSAIPSRLFKGRSCSETKLATTRIPDGKVNYTWYGTSANDNYKELQNQLGKLRTRALSVPVQDHIRSPGLLSRIKNTFKFGKSEENKQFDIEKQEYLPKSTKKESISVDITPHQYLSRTHMGRPSLLPERYLQQTRGGRQSSIIDDPILEQTSVAELFRVLATVMEPEAPEPKRKLGTASLTPPNITPPRTRRLPIRPIFDRRRSSIMHSNNSLNNRRFSVQTIDVASQPPYTPTSSNFIRRSIRVPGTNRRYSLRPVISANTPSSIQRKISRSKDKDERRMSK